MAVDLAFGAPLIPRAGQVDLAFGAQEAGGALLITLAGQLPPLVSAVLVGRLFPANIAATLAPPAGNLELRYDVAVWNGVAVNTCAMVEDAGHTAAAHESAFRHGVRLRVPRYHSTDDAPRLDASATARGAPAPALRVRRCGSFGDAARLGRGNTGANDPLACACVKYCGVFGDASPASAGLVGAQHLLYRRHVRLCAGFDDGQTFGRSHCGGFRFGLPLWRKTCARFERGLPAPWSDHPLIPPPPVPGLCYTPPVGFVALAFDAPLPGHANLAFVCLGQTGPEPGETVIVPVRRVYIVHNRAALIRLPGGESIPCHRLQISTDADAWCWSFSADIAATQLPAIAPENGDPVEVQATINGIAWRFLVEKIRRHRAFGKSGLTISGRSRTAWLAAPYAAPVNHASATPITAQQIINDALPSDWALDWRADDWLIPAGLWAAYATPMEVAQRVSGTIGAILQSHRTGQSLSISHRYPVTPWELALATPAIQIPAAVMVTEGVEWVDKPAWNTVYVSGETQGIIGHVKRAGSAGDIVAPMVTDRLITASEAARQRGTALLCDSGRQARITADMPLMPDEGLSLITPGMVLEIADGADVWRGYARGVSVSTKLPQVRQTIEIERPIL